MSLVTLAKSAPVPFALVAWLFASSACSSSNDNNPGQGSNDGGGGDATASTGGGDGGSNTNPDGGPKTNPDGGGTQTSDDGGGDQDAYVPPPYDGGGDAGQGHVLVAYPSAVLDSGVDEWIDFPAASGAPSTSLWSTLNDISPGGSTPAQDSYAGLSRDGVWVALVTTRFGCTVSNGQCLAIAKVDGSSGNLLKPGGVETYPEERAAVASGGALVVYPNNGGPHGWDLYATSLSGGSWSAPLLLTSGMAAQFAHNIGFSPDSSKVVFECGPSQYQASATDICVSNVDGSGTSIVVNHMVGPSATDANYTHHPDFAPDGTIVFEADWVQGGGSTERIWRLTAPSTVVLVSPTGVGDDNSPCVMPDGRIASLWLPNSNHEVKIMNADGSNGIVLESNVDVVDVGQSCSR